MAINGGFLDNWWWEKCNSISRERSTKSELCYFRLKKKEQNKNLWVRLREDQQFAWMSNDAFYVTKHQGVLQAKETGNQVLQIQTRISMFHVF